MTENDNPDITKEPPVPEGATVHGQPLSGGDKSETRAVVTTPGSELGKAMDARGKTIGAHTPQGIDLRLADLTNQLDAGVISEEDYKRAAAALARENNSPNLKR
jgi:hypothetical protein